MNDNTTGVILAGGRGSRLYPLTYAVSKQLLPVFDKPLIYYPLTTLMSLGISKIVLVSGPKEIEKFQLLLGNGKDFGIEILYKIQEEPLGIAHGLLQAESMVEKDVILILGDNIFFSANAGNVIFDFEKKGASICAIESDRPEEFGVLSLNDNGEILEIEEKPKLPKSNWIVPGIYRYDSDVFEMIKSQKISIRGELEITDLNSRYLSDKKLSAFKLDKQTIWYDAGTQEELLAASEMVRIIQKETNRLIGSPHLQAFLNGNKLINLDKTQSESSYFKALKNQI